MGDVKSVLQWAMEIADDLPEKYQEAAFAELLRHALSSIQGAAEVDTVADIQAKPALQKKLIGKLPKDYLVAGKGSRDQQTVWAVVKLLERGEEATSESVRKIIKTCLGVSPESLRNTSGRLGKLTPRHVKRKEREAGKGYAYTPTVRALEVFEGLEE